MVVWASPIPRSAIIWTRSRELSLKARYHRTHSAMISWSKCRPLKRSCAEVGSVIPGVTAVHRTFQAFAPEPTAFGNFFNNRGVHSNAPLNYVGGMGRWRPPILPIFDCQIQNFHRLGSAIRDVRM